MPISNYAEAQLLDAVFNNDSFVVAATFIKLHIGDPGEDCTANPAAHTTRVASSWTTATVGAGSLSNDAAVVFTPLAATETISFISVWDAIGPAGGNALWYGPLTVPQNVNVGGTLSFGISAIAVTLT